MVKMVNFVMYFFTITKKKKKEYCHMNFSNYKQSKKTKIDRKIFKTVMVVNFLNTN